MRKGSLLFFALLINYLSFCQDVIHDANVEKRGVGSFHAIRVGGGIDLYLTQSDVQSVAVSASNTRYRKKIKTEVKDGVLTIRYDELEVSLTFTNRKLKAYVSVTDLNELKASGGSDVLIKSGIKTSNLKLILSGGSDFKGSVDAGQMSIRISGGSDVTIEGKAGQVEVIASGGSDFNGYKLISDNATVKVSGGSDATITVNKELAVTASGGSDVYYKGSGVITHMSAGKSSSVSKRG